MYKTISKSTFFGLAILTFTLPMFCDTTRMVDPPMPKLDHTFLALGDSYTIGQSVTVDERWPNQLAALLADNSVEVAQPQIIARTGWTTGDLWSALQSSERSRGGPSAHAGTLPASGPGRCPW